MPNWASTRPAWKSFTLDKPAISSFPYILKSDHCWGRWGPHHCPMLLEVMTCSQPPTGYQGPSQQIKERRPRHCLSTHLLHLLPTQPWLLLNRFLTPPAIPLSFLCLLSWRGLLQHAVHPPGSFWMKFHLTSVPTRDGDHTSYDPCWTLGSSLRTFVTF